MAQHSMPSRVRRAERRRSGSALTRLVHDGPNASRSDESRPPSVTPSASSRGTTSARAACRSSFAQVRILVAPADLRITEFDPAERAADRDVGQRIVIAVAPGPSAEAGRHRLQRAVDLAGAAAPPTCRCARLRRAASASRRIRMAASARPSASASQHLTSARSRPLAGMQLADRRQRVEILDDDARIEHRAAILHDQAGHLARAGSTRRSSCRRSRRPRERTGSPASSRS